MTRRYFIPFDFQFSFLCSDGVFVSLQADGRPKERQGSKSVESDYFRVALDNTRERREGSFGDRGV